MQRMKGFFGLVAAAVLGAILVNTGPAVSSAISILTGPQPAADLVSIVNNLINNINTKVSAAGAGNVSESVYVPACSGCSNWVSLSGGASIAAPASNFATIATFGPKASVSMVLSPQGVSGFVQFGNPNNILLPATNSVPTGFGSGIRRWIIVLDSQGNSGVVPVYGNAPTGG